MDALVEVDRKLAGDLLVVRLDLLGLLVLSPAQAV
jgi:hypothetical protein